jgi:Zn-dependent M28 family amino/carboxypeptidase
VAARRWRAQGYDVRLDTFRVPAGISWGVPVPAGQTTNVVAAPPGFRPDEPHLLVGAHLDTVPQAPGAEDNASGIAVLVEVTRLAAAAGTRLPVVFVAFGAEEPRGEGDALHHFGSQEYVGRATPAQRDALRAMVSLDRVGVGTSVPVCTGGLSPLRLQQDLLALARRLGTPATACTDNQASDHWSFEKDGTTAARLGGTSYAAYHSAADRPGVVSRAQLGRVGELIWAWLRPRG